MNLVSVVVVPPVTVPGQPTELLAMQRAANRPIACHAVEAGVRAETRGVVLVAPKTELEGVRASMAEDLGLAKSVKYVPYSAAGGLGAALAAAIPAVGEAASLVHLADGLIDQPLDEFTDRLRDPDPPDLLLLLHRTINDDDRLDPAAQAGLGLTEMAGTPTHLALTGVCLFGPGAMARAVRSLPPTGHRATLGTMAQRLVSQQAAVGVALVRCWRRYRGHPRELLELNRLVLDRQSADGQLHQVADSRIEGRVIIDPTADVRASTILGPCIIGAHAQINDSYIGPYTSVGPGAEIEGTEVVGSIIAEGARILHIQGRIESSTIGRRASIFRDFRLPRAMRLHVGGDVELALD